MQHQSASKGFTLIELLVVLAVIGILVSLLLVGVQHVRESSRSAACANKIRQVALASLNFESSAGGLPAAGWARVVLERMEQGALIQSLESGGTSMPSRIPILTCPSDVTPVESGTTLYSNYVGNAGTWQSMFGKQDGAIVDVMDEATGIALAEISDGTSHVVMFSEVLLGEGRLRTVWQTPGDPYGPDEYDALAKICRDLPKHPAEYGWRGAGFIKGRIAEINLQGPVRFAPITAPTADLYNHAMPPNNPSVLNHGGFPTSMATTTSVHGDYVNLVFCDGHVERIAQDIDLPVWFSLGSRLDGNPK